MSRVGSDILSSGLAKSDGMKYEMFDVGVDTRDTRQAALQLTGSWICSRLVATLYYERIVIGLLSS